MCYLQLKVVAEGSAKDLHDLQDVKLIGSFSALQDSEQADTTQRLVKLGQTLVIAHSRMVPLINLVLLCTQDCSNKLKQQIAKAATATNRSERRSPLMSNPNRL